MLHSNSNGFFPKKQTPQRFSGTICSSCFATHNHRLLIVQTLPQKHLLILPHPHTLSLLLTHTHTHMHTTASRTCTRTHIHTHIHKQFLHLSYSLSFNKVPLHKCSYLHIRLSFVFETNFQLGLEWLADLFSTFAQL